MHWNVYWNTDPASNTTGCCACNGACYHVGPHSFCNKHGLSNQAYSPPSYCPNCGHKL